MRRITPIENINLHALIYLVSTAILGWLRRIAPVLLAEAILLVKGQLSIIRIDENEHQEWEEHRSDHLREHVEPAILRVEFEKFVGVHCVGDEAALVFINHRLNINILFTLGFLFLWGRRLLLSSSCLLWLLLRTLSATFCWCVFLLWGSGSWSCYLFLLLLTTAGLIWRFRRLRGYCILGSRNLLSIHSVRWIRIYGGRFFGIYWRCCSLDGVCCSRLGMIFCRFSCCFFGSFWRRRCRFLLLSLWLCLRSLLPLVLYFGDFFRVLIGCVWISILILRIRLPLSIIRKCLLRRHAIYKHVAPDVIFVFVTKF